MSVGAGFVEQIAELAYLKLEKDELAAYQKSMQSILAYMDSLAELDASLPGLWQNETLEGSCPEREDVVGESLGVEAALREAPQASASAFKVPKIIG